MVHTRHMHLSRHLMECGMCRFGREARGARYLPEKRVKEAKTGVSDRKEAFPGAIP